MKIEILLFLSIYMYSLCLRVSRFLGPHDTLPCVLFLSTEEYYFCYSYLLQFYPFGISNGDSAPQLRYDVPAEVYLDHSFCFYGKTITRLYVCYPIMIICALFLEFVLQGVCVCLYTYEYMHVISYPRGQIIFRILLSVCVPMTSL